MPDDIGVRVVLREGSDAFEWFEPACSPEDVTHLAIPLDAESLARLRERVCKALNDILDDEDAVDATFAAFAALGLEP